MKPSAKTQALIVSAHKKYQLFGSKLEDYVKVKCCYCFVLHFKKTTVTLVWYGVVWYALVCIGMVWYALVWYGMPWYGMVCLGMVCLGIVYLGQLM